MVGERVCPCGSAAVGQTRIDGILVLQCSTCGRVTSEESCDIGGCSRPALARCSTCNRPACREHVTKRKGRLAARCQRCIAQSERDGRSLLRTNRGPRRGGWQRTGNLHAD